MQSEIVKSEGEPAGETKTPPYAWYVVGVMTLVYAIHTMDRNVFTILLPLIGKEFHLNDTQLGFLAGASYAAAYVVAGIPLGMLTDRMNRRWLLGGLVGGWSLITALAGWAGNFSHLLMTRIGMAAAESGGVPLCVSLISDYVHERRRAVATSIFISGTAIGGLIGMAATGFVAAAWGWRAAFMVIGVPGILVALLVLLTVREPRAARAASAADPEGRAPGIGAAFGELRRNHALLLSIIGMTLTSCGASAVGVWLPAFLNRTHEMPIAHAGLATAMVVTVPGLLGAYGSAFLMSRLGSSLSVLCWTAVVGALLGGAGGALGVWVGSIPLALSILLFWALGLVLVQAPAMALIATLSPVRLRGTILAVYGVVSNVVGYGAGPQMVGFLSDLLQPTLGGASLRTAMALAATIYVVSALCFVGALAHLRRPKT